MGLLVFAALFVVVAYTKSTTTTKMMAFSLSSCSSSCSSECGFGLRSSALETKQKRKARSVRTTFVVRTRAANADDVTRDLKTSRTTITTTTVARVLTAFVVALSSSAPGDVAQADGQVFGLTPKVLAPGKTVVLPERTSSADITREDARIVPHKAKENFLEGCKTITGEPCEGSPEWESAQRGGKVGGENSA